MWLIHVMIQLACGMCHVPHVCQASWAVQHELWQCCSKGRAELAPHQEVQEQQQLQSALLKASPTWYLRKQVAVYVFGNQRMCRLAALFSCRDQSLLHQSIKHDSRLSPMLVDTFWLVCIAGVDGSAYARVVGTSKFAVNLLGTTRT